MICDDEHLIAESVDRLLKKVSDKNGIKLKTQISCNGIECLYQIYRSFIEGKKIDMLLIDENMPFMIGSECIKILRNLMADKKITKFKIYSITGYVDTEHINYIKASGSDGFYSKPISLNMTHDLLIKSGLIQKDEAKKKYSNNVYVKNYEKQGVKLKSNEQVITDRTKV